MPQTVWIVAEATYGETVPGLHLFTSRAAAIERLTDLVNAHFAQFDEEPDASKAAEMQMECMAEIADLSPDKNTVTLSDDYVLSLQQGDILDSDTAPVCA